MILSIETSIKNGSLALLRENGEIDEWSGSGEVSRSVDLIVRIGELLRRNRADKKEIQKILVSRGPGSFTGLRVGISTAKGLSLALGCAVGGISILRAMAEPHKNKKRVLSLVSAGRGLFFWQTFDFENNTGESAGRDSERIGEQLIVSEILTGNLENLRGSPSGKNLSQLVVQPEAFENLTDSDEGKDFLQKTEYVVLEGNPAAIIARLNEANPRLFGKNVEPLYAREAAVVGR